MKKVFALVSLLLAVLPTVPAEAQDFQVFFAKYREVGEAWGRSDSAAVARLTRPFAEQGVVRAQSLLGNLYISGLGVPQDDAEAVKWYRLAAEQGQAGAQEILGLLYEKGRGVKQDLVQAHAWYDIAAVRGGRDRCDQS